MNEGAGGGSSEPSGGGEPNDVVAKPKRGRGRPKKGGMFDFAKGTVDQDPAPTDTGKPLPSSSHAEPKNKRMSTKDRWSVGTTGRLKKEAGADPERSALWRLKNQLEENEKKARGKEGHDDTVN